MIMKKQSKLDVNYAKYIEYYAKYKKNNYMTPMMSKEEYKEQYNLLTKRLKVPDPEHLAEFKNISKNKARYLASSHKTLSERDVSVIRKGGRYGDLSRKQIKELDWKSEYKKYNPNAAMEWTDPRTGRTHQYTQRQAWYFMMMDLFDGDEGVIY